jgi:transcriptional regulator with XRE-family HTH domain
MDILSRRLRIAIRTKGISQLELAQKVGVSEKSISFYIHNKSTPRISILAKLAKALDTSVDWLLGLYPTEFHDFEASFLSLTPEQRKIILALMETVVADTIEPVDQQLTAPKSTTHHLAP